MSIAIDLETTFRSLQPLAPVDRVALGEWLLLDVPGFAPQGSELAAEVRDKLREIRDGAVQEPQLNEAIQLIGEYVAETGDRVELAERLRASVPGFATPEIEEAWNEEIRRRLEQVDNGTADLVTPEQMFREMEMAIDEVHRPTDCGEAGGD